MIDFLLLTLFASYLLTGTIYWVMQTVAEIKTVLVALKSNAADIDSDLINMLDSLSELEKLIGTKTTLLCFCIISFLNNMWLVLAWPCNPSSK